MIEENSYEGAIGFLTRYRIIRGVNFYNSPCKLASSLVLARHLPRSQLVKQAGLRSGVDLYNDFRKKMV